MPGGPGQFLGLTLKWNSLTEEVVTSPSIRVFESRLDKMSFTRSFTWSVTLNHRTLSSIDLKEFTDVASTALDGKQFHLLITRSEVKSNVS